MGDTIDRLDDAFRAPSPPLSPSTPSETSLPSGGDDSSNSSSPLDSAGTGQGTTASLPLLQARINGAIESLQSREIASVHEAAVRYFLPESLLRNRYYGENPEPLAGAFQPPLKLTEGDETRICDYIVQWLELGFPPSPHILRDAGNVLQKRKCELIHMNYKPLPQNWGRQLLKRHPQLKATWDSYTENHKRTKQAQPDKISSFLDLFEKTRKQYNIHPDDIWNADVKGFMLEKRTATQETIISDKSLQHKASRSLAPSEDWVSTIECCNTAGQILAPYVIFQGDAVSFYWNLMIPDKKALVGYDEKGLIDEHHQLMWLNRAFVPQTAMSRKTLSNRGTLSDRVARLLLLDGHSSPVSFEFFLTCRENQIIPLCIPPSTSHLLHPLDVGVLSKFNEIYTDELRLALQAGQFRISRGQFVPLWWLSRQEALDPENIIMGWRNSGMWPVSKGVVYKRAGFDLPEARAALDLTQLKVPNTEEKFHSLLHQMISSPPETATQLREFLIGCYDQKCRAADLLQERLSNQYNLQVSSTMRDLYGDDAEIAKRRAEDDPAARTACRRKRHCSTARV